MNKYNFKVGDRVRIRQWDDMVKEFGTHKSGSINVKCGFSPGMAELCGHTAIIVAIGENDAVQLACWDDDSLDVNWGYSIGMLEPVETESTEVTPAHYKIGDYACYEEMIELFGVEAFKHFCQLCIYKYRYRASAKGGEQDIAKANQYMKMLRDLEKE